MRIVFMGTPEFSVPSLRALIESEDQVVALVTQPDKPKGRGRELTPPPAKVLAQKHVIPVLQPDNIKTEEFHKELESYKPDLICVAAYGKILPPNILDLPDYGCINVHASLLPELRGAAPIRWAIIRGYEVTGVTTMQMDEGMDTGDMLVKKKVTIDYDDTGETLSEKLSHVGAELLVETIRLLKEGKLEPVPQDDSKATYAPMLKKEDGEIDWEKSAEHIRNLIRGTIPWPEAFTTVCGKLLKIYKAEVVEGEGKPGEVIESKPESFKVATGEKSLRILELQIEGANRMETEDFLRGRNIEVGTILGK